MLVKRRCEKENVEQRSLFFIILVAAAMLVFANSLYAAIGDQDDDVKAASKDKIVIKSKAGSKITVSKGEMTTRPGRDGVERRATRRIAPADTDPTPTRLTLTFPNLVYPGDEVKGRLKFYDADDYVYSIFITVFFPDGDVVTDTLYDYRDEGGDIYKGTYSFWVEMSDSETPLPGRIVITCSDEFLNVTEVSQTFVQFF